MHVKVCAEPPLDALALLTPPVAPQRALPTRDSRTSFFGTLLRTGRTARACGGCGSRRTSEARGLPLLQGWMGRRAGPGVSARGVARADLPGVPARTARHQHVARAPARRDLYRERDRARRSRADPALERWGVGSWRATRRLCRASAMRSGRCLRFDIIDENTNSSTTTTTRFCFDTMITSINSTSLRRRDDKN